MERQFSWLPHFHRVEEFNSNIALYKNDQEEYRVIKMLSNIPKHRKWIQRMITNQERAMHHNIVRLLGCKLYEDKHYLQFEYLLGGSLERLLSSRPKLSPPIIRKWTRDLTAALAHLKTLNIVHRCVHPSNIYLSDGNRLSRADAKLGYFLCSKKSLQNAQVSTTFEPDELYTAPELLNHQSYGLPVDVWSLGCVVHFMFTGKAPTGPAPYNPVIPPEAQDFIARCVTDVRYRIDISDAQNHRFLTGIAPPILTPIPPEEVLEEMEKIDAACREAEESEKRQKLIASITEQVKEAIVQVDMYTELLSVYEGKTLADDYAIDLGSLIQTLSRQFPALQAQANELQSRLSQKADDLLDRVRAA